MKSTLTSAVFFLFLIFITGCESAKEKSGKAYDAGIALAKEADASLEKGDTKAAGETYAKAIASFTESIKHDSTHTSARSAIAHAHFKNSNDAEALAWYEKAKGAEPEAAMNYRDMGLIKVKQGELDAGKDLLEKAIALDHSGGNLNEMINGLVAIGNDKFKAGANNKTQGNVEEAKKNQNYAMSVLMLAYYHDNTRKDVAGTIAKYADEVGDYTVKMQYTKLSQQ